jgi:hypothetical protein
MDMANIMINDHAPVPYQPRHAGRRRLSPGGRALAGYVAFFTLALLSIGGVTLLSLLP